jgi:branched-chain amino acid transport system permease protein
MNFEAVMAAPRPQARLRPVLPRLLPRLAALGALVALGASAPWWAGVATLRLLAEFFTLLALAQMWNLLAGTAGLVSVGQQAFVGVGAYALFAVSNATGLNPFAAVLAAAAGAALLAAALAPLLFRLRGAHFAIGTWVLAEVLRIGATNADWLGAGAGLSLEAIGEFDRWSRAAGAYWLALGAALAAIGLLIALAHSAYGVALAAARDDEPAAASIGIDAERLRRTLFILVAAITGACGGIAYIGVLQVNPEAAFSLNWSAFVIFIVVIGGIGTIEGPVMGTILFFLLRETLAAHGTWYLLALGALAVAAMMYAPRGLWGTLAGRPGFDLFLVRCGFTVAAEPPCGGARR